MSFVDLCVGIVNCVIINGTNDEMEANGSEVSQLGQDRFLQIPAEQKH
jgi:hypothetical protein